MRSSIILSAASLLGLSAAIPAAAPEPSSNQNHVERDPPAATAPWVEIKHDGNPETTHTPSATVLDNGSTSISDAAPHDLTATVYTQQWYGVKTTSTGDPPNPTPTGNKKKHDKSGAITRCFNKDGENAPFCAPAEDSVLWVDETYYVTWDPDFFNETGSTPAKPDNRTLEVSLRLDWYNTTSESWDRLKDIDDPDDRVPAAWGYFPFHVSSKLHKGPSRHATNITIKLVTSYMHSKQKNESEVALPVTLEYHFSPDDKPGSVPSGQTLYIALPAVFGSILLLVIGGCLWNRKTRRIQLGNVMGRNRRGYTGRSTRRMFRGRNGADKDDDISLGVRPLGGGTYSDEAPPPSRPRRSTDYYDDDDAALGSLAGTPVDDRFRDQGTAGSTNAFRDEISRQDRQRREQ